MRIKELYLFSSNIDSLKNFYSTVLGIQAIDSNETKVTFRIGESILHFQYHHEATPYHFAINIPWNQIQQALKWLQDRVQIQTYDSKEIIDFSSWNAKATYFYDPDHNIVELIARKNLKINSSDPFSSKQFLEISEIGMVSNDIEKQYNQLHEISGVAIYDGNFEKFCAIGDEHGLFICINKNKKNWFPTGDAAYISDFTVHMEMQKQQYILKYSEERLIQIVG